MRARMPLREIAYIKITLKKCQPPGRMALPFTLFKNLFKVILNILDTIFFFEQTVYSIYIIKYRYMPTFRKHIKYTPPHNIDLHYLHDIQLNTNYCEFMQGPTYDSSIMVIGHI